MGGAAAYGTTINAMNNQLAAPIYYNAAYGSLPPVAPVPRLAPAPIVASAVASPVSSQTVILP